MMNEPLVLNQGVNDECMSVAPIPVPQPQFGYDFVPPLGTIPKALEFKIGMALLKKLADFEAKCQYEGEKDSDGCYHGKGRITYFDGTSYDGHWDHGKKHGEGIYTMADGSINKGPFVHGLMHGPGELMTKDGRVIHATWENGKKNGPGRVTDATGKTCEVIFYNDLEYHLAEQNPDCFDMSLALILLFLVIGFVTPAVLLERMNPWGWLALLAYLGILGEASSCKTNRFISNISHGEYIFEEINTLRTKPPKIDFWIQNYHHETRTSLNKGKITTKTVRVDTWKCEEPFRFCEWYDCSPDSSAVEFVRSMKMARMDFNTKFDYAPQANQSFKCQEYDFLQRNIRDKEHEYKVLNTIEGIRENVLLYNSSLPWYTKKGFFWLFTIFGFSWLLRIIFVSKTKRVTYTFNKVINT